MHCFIKYDKMQYVSLDEITDMYELCSLIEKKIKVPREHFFILIGGKLIKDISEIEKDAMLDVRFRHTKNPNYYSDKSNPNSYVLVEI